jgi:hypothetical protein
MHVIESARLGNNAMPDTGKQIISTWTVDVRSRTDRKQAKIVKSKTKTPAS